jgi:hypothetical protein
VVDARGDEKRASLTTTMMMTTRSLMMRMRMLKKIWMSTAMNRRMTTMTVSRRSLRRRERSA